jgi:hypothetical protein
MPRRIGAGRSSAKIAAQKPHEAEKEVRLGVDEIDASRRRRRCRDRGEQHRLAPRREERREQQRRGQSEDATE